MTLLRPTQVAAPLLFAAPQMAPRTVIAIPARDEAFRLPVCLAALAAQRRPQGGPMDYAATAVLVLANNCSDDTAAAARALAPDLPFTLLVEEVRLPPHLAHAGGARGAAMDAAAALLGSCHGASRHGSPPGALLCTDADARPAPDWLAANLAALAAGADAVAGAIALNPAEAALLPPALRRREAAEARYAHALAALAVMLDAEPHDPWPRHAMHSGASVAVTLEAYRRVGGVPAVASGEDRALFAALARVDARIRHAPEARVLVSCRLEGRAAGGMAAALWARVNDPALPVDPALEPALDAWTRLRSRRALRLLWQGQGEPTRLAARLRVAPGQMAGILRERHFGAAWETLETASPVLRSRRSLAPAQLAAETAKACAMLVRHPLAAASHMLAPAGFPAGSPLGAEAVPTSAAG